jgi:hypothetical protein
MNTREWLPFLFCTGALLFNWPILEVVRIPLPYYLYGVWALFICFVCIIVVFNRDGGHG